MNQETKVDADDARGRSSVEELSDVDVVVVDQDEELLQQGIVRVPLPSKTLLDCAFWATELSQVTPMILAQQGDGQYVFYRNILDDEADFPFDKLLEYFAPYLQAHFDVGVSKPKEEEIRLDDAFCIHYNMTQDDTSGAKHTDPSDITINMCLDASSDLEGSVVQFYGTETLLSTQNQEGKENSVDEKMDDKDKNVSSRFGVRQVPGFAILHWGHHPHETTPLENGQRTNVILTYCFCGPRASNVARRSCYFPN